MARNKPTSAPAPKPTPAQLRVYIVQYQHTHSAVSMLRVLADSPRQAVLTAFVYLTTARGYPVYACTSGTINAAGQREDTYTFANVTFYREDAAWMLAQGMPKRSFGDTYIRAVFPEDFHPTGKVL